MNIKDNPFELFNIKQTYKIDEEILLKKYLALQKQFHPDNYTNKTTQEKLMATQISSNIISSYKDLSDPITRASILLNLAGYSFSLDTQNNQITTTEILITQMQLRERIETANKDELAVILKEIKAKFKSLEKQFTETINIDNLKSAQIIIEMRYYQKLEQDILRI